MNVMWKIQGGIKPSKRGDANGTVPQCKNGSKMGDFRSKNDRKSKKK